MRTSWQGQKDSNPQQRFWRPTCYHYTMPLCCIQRTMVIIHAAASFVNRLNADFSTFWQKIWRPPFCAAQFLALIRTRPRQARLCLYAGISLSLNTHAHSQAYRSDAPENRGFPDYHDRTAQTMPSSVCKPASSPYSPAVRTITRAFCVFDASSRCFADGAAPVRLPPERF